MTNTVPLGERAEQLADAMALLAADVDPDCLSGADATQLYTSVVRVERQTVALKTLLASRIEATRVHTESGHHDAGALLSELEGVPVAQARKTLLLGRQLKELPSTKEAFTNGSLSPAKAAELSRAAVLDPTEESSLLAGAAEETFSEVKDRCARSRATSSATDPLATMRRIRAARTVSWWFDEEGAFCFRGRDTAERGARIINEITSLTNRLRRQERHRRRQASAGAGAGGGAGAAPATPPPGEDPGPTPQCALQADAFFALVTSRRGPGAPATAPASSAPGSTGPAPASTAAPGATGPGGQRVPSRGDPPGDGRLFGFTDDDDPEPDDPAPDDPDGLSEDARSLIDRPPSCSVVVRVDRDALLRGHTAPGEHCEIDGKGPIPVPMARVLANDGELSVVFTQAGVITAVSHLGRTIPKALRTALVHRDRCCVVPRCGVDYGLEIDHVVPFAEGGPTQLDNLALLCHHHHHLKTYEGWTLANEGTTDDGTQVWSFTPQPPFGQEPGLGIDTPEGRAEWRRSQRRNE
jgi:hypothetical protein